MAVALAKHHRQSEIHAESEHQDVIYQVSTLTELLEAVLDGDETYAEIMKHGDFGVGTFNAVDGEMVALDGEFYQLHPGGAVTPVKPEQKTPFAAVTFFNVQAELDIEKPMTESEALALIDGSLPSVDEYFAIRINGEFEALRVRCPKKQKKPYPSLAELTKSQIEVELTNVTGSIIGFRAPQSAQGTTVAGYHLHFIDDARTSGGHVLEFTINEGVVLIDHEADLQVHLPEGAKFRTSQLTQEQIDKMIHDSEG